MKLSRFNLGIFITEAESLCDLVPSLKEASEEWIKLQNRRDAGWTVDQDQINYIRSKVERLLMQFREKMATVYDFQGDRGLVNFEATGLKEHFGMSDEDFRPIPKAASES